MMIVVVFECAGSAPLRVDAAPGDAIIDVCDAKNAPVPFSCRSASCGTCRIDVLEGADLLEPPASSELEVLAIFGDDPARRRLACQARVRGGKPLDRDVSLRIRAAD